MTHTWQITNLKRNLNDGVVTTASYFCSTTYGKETERTSGEYYLADKDPSDADFISYENLSEEGVLSWVTGSLDTASIYSKHSSSIADKINYWNSLSTGEGIPW
jgi:hypothetical protein